MDQIISFFLTTWGAALVLVAIPCFVLLILNLLAAGPAKDRRRE